MNTLLRQAKTEISRLKRKNDTSEITTIGIVLNFERDEDDYKRLVGYSAYEKKIKGKKPTKNEMEKACNEVGINLASILNNKKQCADEITLFIQCTRRQARNIIHKRM